MLISSSFFVFITISFDRSSSMVPILLVVGIGAMLLPMVLFREMDEAHASVKHLRQSREPELDRVFENLVGLDLSLIHISEPTRPY